MKKIVLLLLLLLLVIVKLNAQFREKTLVYGSFEIQAGNYFGFNANINYVFNNTYSFKLGYTGLSNSNINTPEDFQKGGFIWGQPLDRIGNYYFLIGKIYQINKAKKNIQANISMGLGYLINREPENFEYTGSSLFSTSNYTWDYTRKDEISFVFNPKVEFLMTNAFGMNFSPLFQISKNKAYYGAGIGVIFRLVKKKNSD